MSHLVKMLTMLARWSKRDKTNCSAETAIVGMHCSKHDAATKTLEYNYLQIVTSDQLGQPAVDGHFRRIGISLAGKPCQSQSCEPYKYRTRVASPDLPDAACYDRTWSQKIRSDLLPRSPVRLEAASPKGRIGLPM